MFLAYLLVKAVLGTIGCGATIYLPISGLNRIRFYHEFCSFGRIFF